MYVHTSNFKEIFMKKVPQNFVIIICLIIFRLLFGQLINTIDISRNFRYFIYAVAYLITVVTIRCSNK